MRRLDPSHFQEGKLRGSCIFSTIIIAKYSPLHIGLLDDFFSHQFPYTQDRGHMYHLMTKTAGMPRQASSIQYKEHSGVLGKRT